VRNGTTIGVMMAPIFVPALNSPVANARSDRGKPLRNGFDRRGEVARFAEAERKPCGDEAGNGRGIMEANKAEQYGSGGAEYGGARVRDGRKGPDREGQREANLGPDTIHQPAGEDESDRVGQLE
jgi:hypothetical protein